MSTIFEGRRIMDEHKDDAAEEIRALIAQCEGATDPESLWVLRLLREALKRLEGGREPPDQDAEG